jgi:hypothetical protein
MFVFTLSMGYSIGGDGFAVEAHVEAHGPCPAFATGVPEKVVTVTF